MSIQTAPRAMSPAAESDYSSVVSDGSHMFAGRLQDTIDTFNHLSSQLQDSYLELEERVQLLKGELQESDRQRAFELDEKKRLASRFERILDVMPTAVITLNGNGRVEHVNDAARMLLGEPLEGERWIDIINRCFLPDPTDGHEIVLKNGKLVSLATQSLGDEPGQIIVLNDLTETRHLQRQLSHHQKLSEMGKMTASLAHQVRTPLATALLYADHLAQPKLGSVRKIRFAQKLKEQLLHLQSQVNDMLIFSKGGIVINDYEHVGKFLFGLTHRFEEMSVRKGVHVYTELLTMGMTMKCNSDLLTSAFSNLIENSIQAMAEHGTPNPTIYVKAEECPHGIIKLSVVDNGPGVPNELLEKIREPFFTTKSTGTGLGLAVVQAVVLAHGAEMAVFNREEGGLQIDISMPLQKAVLKAS